VVLHKVLNHLFRRASLGAAGKGTGLGGREDNFRGRSAEGADQGAPRETLGRGHEHNGAFARGMAAAAGIREMAKERKI